MRLKAERGERDGKQGWILNGQKTWTTSAHFAEWYWLGTRTDPDNKHMGITLMLVPLDQPGVTIKGIWTMGDERTNEVFIEDVFVPDEYVVGEVNRGFQYISQALDLERFTMFTFSPMKQRLDLLIDYVNTAVRDGVPLRDDPVVRQRIAQLVTDAEVARVLGLKVVAASMKGEKVPGTPPPTVESSKYKLFATEFSRRLASASMDIGGPGTQLRVRVNPDAPMAGPGGVDVSLHRDRHDRRRFVGDPEERHRPARARSPEELLSAHVLQGCDRSRSRVGGSGGAHVALAGRLRRARREGRSAAEAVGRADRAAVLRVQRAPRHGAGAARPEVGRGPRCVPAARGEGRRRDRELPPRRDGAARSRRRGGPRGRIPRSSTARRAATGRPARVRSGPATTSTTSRSAATSTAPVATPTADPRCRARRSATPRAAGCRR